MATREWKPIKEYTDILFEQYKGIAKITINRPEVYNAFRPLTNHEMLDAFEICRGRDDIRVIILTGAGDKAFCSGGDQHYKTQGGYRDSDGTPRLNVLDLHKMIRSIPKPVVAMVNGYAIGGGNVLNVVCDLSIASENARFGQTGPKVGSFDGGFGSSYLARCVGQKKTREIWYLCRQYTAKEAEEMGMINKVVPFDRLEDELLMVRDNDETQPVCNPHGETMPQRRARRPARSDGARRRRDTDVLPYGRGARRKECVS